MGRKKCTTGEELFGSRIEAPYAVFELYSELDVSRLELRRRFGGLLEGGPEVDIEHLEELRRKRRLDDRKASEDLKELLRYQLWFRYAQALNVRDFPGDLEA